MLLVAAAFFLVRRRVPATMPTYVVVAFGLALWLFYALYVPAIWFFPRYLAPTHLALTLVMAFLVAAITKWSRSGRWVPVSLVVLLSLFPCARLGAYVTTSPDGTVDTGLKGAKGYLEPATQIVAMAPEGAVIGSLQTGALGYVSETVPGRVRIVNLDGVVDAEAAAALAHRKLARFSVSRGVTHLADWEFNIDNFLRFSGDPRLTRKNLKAIGEARPQGPDRFKLYSIEWP